MSAAEHDLELHSPAPGRSRANVVSTYRLQLQPEFDFDAAAAAVPYLARLGVTHLYLSPVLQATPGSTHGYDVVDHTRLSADLGGQPAFDRLVAAAHEAGLGIVVDVVPNHMAVPTPLHLNAKLWAVLRDGPSSPYARWFDVDWSLQSGTGHGAILMPVLGDRIGQCLDRGEIQRDQYAGAPILRYFDHVFPVRPGTEHLPLDELLDMQFYRLAFWRIADEELNYRRFFDIDTLAAIRAEDPTVFAASHDLLIRLHREGKVDGYRIDHPDGLADPRGYLRRLAAATGDAWVAAEKILEAEEPLPADWPCAGSTGYDALWRVQSLFVDPDGAAPLLRLWTSLTGEPDTLQPVVDEAKRYIVDQVLAAEVVRLVELLMAIGEHDIRLRDFTRRRLTRALGELLVAFDVYRAYVHPGEPLAPEAEETVRAAAARATTAAPDLAEEIEFLVGVALGGHDCSGARAQQDEFCVRFQQTTGPVMAKGIEDTAFYRWFPLVSLCEVGAPADRFGIAPDTFHEWAAGATARHPSAMTTLSTHDTKRTEDVRARLAVLSELPAVWEHTVSALREATAGYRPEPLDTATEYLLWQILVGAWPIEADRLVEFVTKATREAKRHTTWTEPNEAYDEAVTGFARAVVADENVVRLVRTFVDTIAPYDRANVLGQKLVQLTCTGVPDVYQGTELRSLTLVDPDNRRPVDFTERVRLLDRLDAGDPVAEIDGGSLDAEKLLVTAATLRCRAAHPDWFVGPGASYTPLETTSPHALAFLRGGTAATVVTRLSAGLAAADGWGSATVDLPAGSWTDQFTGQRVDGGKVRLDQLLARRPVALLVREDDGT
ncbi:malto-oligosyltrehalose synthase [Actinopolymorpha singaporensis]